MEDGPAGAQLLPPAEADWPPELRLPAPPPPPPGMDDSQFLGSIMGESARQGPAEQQGALVTAPLVVPKKRGRPPKKGDGSPLVAPPAKPAKRRENEEEVVCFICFDGGNLVVCDRRSVPRRLRMFLPGTLLILSVDVGDAPRSTIRHASSVTNPSSIRGASGTAVSSSNALILLLTVTCLHTG
jgi:hypothetical protein